MAQQHHVDPTACEPEHQRAFTPGSNCTTDTVSEGSSNDCQHETKAAHSLSWWSNVPASAFLIQQPISRKPVIAAQFCVPSFPIEEMDTGSHGKSGDHDGAMVDVCETEKSQPSKETISSDSSVTITHDWSSVAFSEALPTKLKPDSAAILDTETVHEVPSTVACTSMAPIDSLASSTALKTPLLSAHMPPQTRLQPEHSSPSQVDQVQAGGCEDCEGEGESTSMDLEENFICAMDVEGILFEQSNESTDSLLADPVSFIDVESLCFDVEGKQGKRKKIVTRKDEEMGAESKSRKRKWKLYSKYDGKKEAVASKKGKILEGNSQEEEDISGGHKKQKKPRPNAFVSVRIPSVEIEDKLREVQEEMVARNKKAKSVMVPLKKLHITLMVLRLEGEEDIERARGVLAEATLEASSTLGLVSSPLILEFSGIGSFGKRVVFTMLKEGPSRDRLASIATIVRSTFERRGFPLTDRREFTPHLTIAKVSQNRRGLTHIDRELYETFADSEIGCQEILGLELLSMVEPQASDGYYHCLHRCLFAGDSDLGLSSGSRLDHSTMVDSAGGGDIATAVAGSSKGNV